MPTLFGVKAGEKFSKGVPKDFFRKLFIISLKTKGGTKGKFFTLNGEINIYKKKVFLCYVFGPFDRQFDGQ